MKQLIDLLHLLLCQKPHVYDILKLSERATTNCYYYLENDIADGNQLEDHLLWEEVKEKFKVSMDLKSDQEALNFVKRCIQFSQNINSLTNGNFARGEFVKMLILKVKES